MYSIYIYLYSSFSNTCIFIDFKRSNLLYTWWTITIHNSLKYKVVKYNYLMTNWKCLSIEILSASNLQSNIYVTNVYNKPHYTVENMNIFNLFNKFLYCFKINGSVIRHNLYVSILI